MIKYKLIKEYPNCSIEAGEYEWFEDLNNHSKHWRGITFYNKYSEYYEKVEETYKILKKENGVITSIERLRDNEIFNIGDKIQLDNWKDDWYELSKIEIKNNNVMFWLLYNEDTYPYCFFDTFINKQSVKKIITLNSGETIEEGDNYWFVDKNDYSLSIVIKEDFYYNMVNDNCIDFATKESAEKWVENNKPRFSLVDIEKCIEGSIFHSTDLLKVINFTKLKQNAGI